MSTSIWGRPFRVSFRLLLFFCTPSSCFSSVLNIDFLQLSLEKKKRLVCSPGGSGFFCFASRSPSCSFSGGRPVVRWRYVEVRRTPSILHLVYRAYLRLRAVSAGYWCARTLNEQQATFHELRDGQTVYLIAIDFVYRLVNCRPDQISSAFIIECLV